MNQYKQRGASPIIISFLSSILDFFLRIHFMFCRLGNNNLRIPTSNSYEGRKQILYHFPKLIPVFFQTNRNANHFLV
jgi:hypothetical protein